MQSLKSVVEEEKALTCLRETNKMDKSNTNTTTTIEVHNKGTGLRRISCWNCGDENHIRRECPHREPAYSDIQITNSLADVPKVAASEILVGAEAVEARVP